MAGILCLLRNQKFISAAQYNKPLDWFLLSNLIQRSEFVSDIAFLPHLIAKLYSAIRYAKI